MQIGKGDQRSLRPALQGFQMTTDLVPDLGAEGPQRYFVHGFFQPAQRLVGLSCLRQGAPGLQGQQQGVQAGVGLF